MRLLRKWHWFLIAMFSAVTAVAILRTTGSRPAFYVGQTFDEFAERNSAYAREQTRLPPFRYTSLQVLGGSDANAYIYTTDFYLRSGHVFARRRLAAAVSDRTGKITFVRSTWEWTPWRL
jgi:hypothetical protein